MVFEAGIRKYNFLIAVTSLFVIISIGCYMFSFMQVNHTLEEKHGDALRSMEKYSLLFAKCDGKLKMCHSDKYVITKSNSDLQDSIAGKEKEIADIDRELDVVKRRLDSAYSFFLLVNEYLGNPDSFDFAEKELPPLTVESLKKKLSEWKSERLLHKKLNESYIMLKQNDIKWRKEYNILKDNFTVLKEEHKMLMVEYNKIEKRKSALVLHLNNSYSMQMQVNEKLRKKIYVYESQLNSTNSTLLPMKSDGISN